MFQLQFHPTLCTDQFCRSKEFSALEKQNRPYFVKIEVTVIHVASNFVFRRGGSYA